ncbi:ABC transporter permease [Rummeliibacillus suwonensis]|uniref:ABC transporter permease n=1 Tax=Rummeliibacillus suwonensis TaxID=1306154 RepID=UPI001AAEF20A|nr:ABC transporter permease [Rummeliibacillus suwonensis]MBO2535742.1 ABC transporter permease [Rummeliibacillus suwonensis]
MDYVLKKTVSSLFTLFVVIVFVFLAFRIIPGNPANIILGVEATPAQVEELEQKLGLDQTLFEQFIHWFKGVLVLDFGESLRFSEPVLSLIHERMGVTFSLAFMAIFITIFVSIPLGIIAANYKGKFLDVLISIGTQIGLAIPSFWMGIILIMIFGLMLHLISVGGYVPWSENPLLAFKALLFPATAIAIPQIAILVRYLRTTMIEQLNFDYVRTAKSKGLKDSTILLKHVLKNALIPVITIAGLNFGAILAGSLVIEQVYALPGFGRMLITAIGDRDFPLVQGMVVMIAIIAIAVNLLVDLSYRYLDPKIKLK